MAKRSSAAGTREKKLVCIVGSDAVHQEMPGRVSEAKDCNLDQVLHRTDMQQRYRLSRILFTCHFSSALGSRAAGWGLVVGRRGTGFCF